jgi:hypothetical protein
VPDGKKTYDSVFVDLLIEDGKDQVIEVVGKVSECVVSYGPKFLNFESLAVGEKKELVLTLNNDNQKSSGVYFIDKDSLPPYLKLSKYQAKIHASSYDKIFVYFCSNIAKTYNTTIEIKWRGGKVMNVPISAEVIIPKIEIYEDKFDFGIVTYGNTVELEMHIENVSPIPARLKLDLRGDTSNDKLDGI